MRTVRVRSANRSGTGARLLASIADLGGSVGSIEMLSETPSGELMPNPLDKKVHRAVARPVAGTAIRPGIARAEYVPYVEE